MKFYTMKLKKLLFVALPVMALCCGGFSSCSSEAKKESDPRITDLPFESYTDSIIIKKAHILDWKVEKDQWSGESKRRYLETYLGGREIWERQLTLTYDLENKDITIEVNNNKYAIGDEIIFETFDLKGQITSKKQYKFHRRNFDFDKVVFKSSTISDFEEKTFLRECFIPLKCNEARDSCVFVTDTLYRYTKITIPLGRLNIKDDGETTFKEQSNMQFGWINYNEELEKAKRQKQFINQFNFLRH